MADGTSVSDILRSTEINDLYSPTPVAEPVGGGFWSTAEQFVTGLFDNLPTLAKIGVTYFPPKTTSGYGTVPVIRTAPVYRVPGLNVPPSATVGRLTAPPLVSDLEREGGGGFMGMDTQTLLLIGGGAVLLFILLRS